MVQCKRCGYSRELHYTYKYKNPDGICSKCGVELRSIKIMARTSRDEIAIRKLFRNMKARCYGKYKAYENYKSKGIIICDEWLNNVSSFVDWSFRNGYKNGLSIDRIDNSKGYSPNNCQWITKIENSTKDAFKMRKCNSTGFIGVWFRKDTNRYSAEIKSNGKKISIGCYHTAYEASLARDEYIISNNLPHKLNKGIK